MSSTIDDARLIEIPKIRNKRGNLSVIEGDLIPFEIKRVHYLYDIPSNAERKGHSHITQQKLLVALSGSFDIIVKDGTSQKTVSLNKPNSGLLIPAGIWREIGNFSSGSVCLVIASDDFEETDYIRDFETFRSSKNRTT